MITLKIRIMKKSIAFIIAALGCLTNVDAQVYQTFKDTRIINSHSTEVLGKGQLDIRIAHRFGDMFGDAGGWETFYGLEKAEDVQIGAEYGVTKNFMVGISRTKGSGDLKQNVNGIFKWRFIHQNDAENLPISAALTGTASVSTQPANEEGSTVNSFPEFTHRMVFHTSFLIARKFNRSISLQVGGGFTHRNLVIETEDNDILNFSFAGRFQVTSGLGIIVDATFPFADNISADQTIYPALGLGIEYETGGGHVFQINLTNSRGIMETDYIPYTTSDLREGQFRLGFTISRLFILSND